MIPATTPTILTTSDDPHDSRQAAAEQRARGAHAAIVALCLSVATACSGDPDSGVAVDEAEKTEQSAPDDDAPPRLSADDLAQVLESGEVFFLDVRSPEEIRELGTLPDHVNIPIDELERRLVEVPKDMPVVTA